MTSDRIPRLQARMKEQGLHLYWVRSTDAYLNEYVPQKASLRVWMSGFTGSMGELLVGQDFAQLFVDGRYWLQADQETEGGPIQVTHVPHGVDVDQALIDFILASKPETGSETLRIGFPADRMTPALLDRLKTALQAMHPELQPWMPGLDVALRREMEGEDTEAPSFTLRSLSDAVAGQSLKAKLAAIQAAIPAGDPQNLLLQQLDAIAWLSNLRGDELPYQATFRCEALVTPSTLFLSAPSFAPFEGLELPEALKLVDTAGFEAAIREAGDIGYDPKENTEAGRLRLVKLAKSVRPSQSPIAKLKAAKNPAELKAMRSALQKADRVVETVIAWTCEAIQRGERISEARFADEVKAQFLASGAVGLSFSTIAAAGKNGAVIHYSHPNPERILQAGELMLLDTGAYYEEGYATDLTRTFLVGGPEVEASSEQKRIYTLVLKAAIAGMSARFPKGTQGIQLDAIVRAPLWAECANFAHGTGHGVGVNVHETPPRVAPGSLMPLEVGQVFSIEPGLYLPHFGGVRIENLVTVEPVVDHEDFLQIVPLTFSKLDPRLIDMRLLTAFEQRWLKGYQDTRDRQLCEAKD